MTARQTCKELLARYGIARIPLSRSTPSSAPAR